MEVGIFDWEVATGRWRFSERCKRLWGFSLEEDMTSEMILSRVHPDDQHLIEVVAGAVAPGGSGRFCIEHRIVLPEGQVRWVRVSGQTHAREGIPLRGYGAMRDITDSKLADAQLAERTAQLKAFVQGAPVPMAIFDRDMRFIEVSDRYLEEWQLTPSDLIGRTAYEVLPDMPLRWPALHQRVMGGATESCDCEPWVMRDGRHGWLRWELRPWYRADNEVGGVILLSEWVTARVQEQQALRDSRTRLELALQAGSLGVYNRDLSTGHIDWDQRIRAMWGFSPEETVTIEMFIQGIHPDDRAYVARSIKELIDGGASGLFNVEYRVINRLDGSIRWIASTGRIYFDEHAHSIGVVHDITERKRAQLALEHSTQELRRADEQKNLYLATLSHELRTPLASIATAAHLLTSPKLSSRQLRWVSQLIRRQTGQMAFLLDDLLDITRICRGTLELRKEHASLADIVRSAVEGAQPLIDEKHHRLVVSLPPEPLHIHVDPARLSQVLSNLLTNAAKYTDPRGQIELTATLQNQTLVLSVRDNGIGIRPDTLDKIFRMFWQGDDRSGRSQGGLGIGLALVQGIVQLHGGTIEAHSEGPGRGSELIVRLPVPDLPRVPAAPAAASVSSAPHRVLVAEDDRDIAATLEALLKRAHHQVRIAHNAREAVSAARDFHPDVALLDLSMPGLDGYGVAQTLRQEPWAAGLRLIALTGGGQPEELRRFSDSGFDEQLFKPVDPDRLRSLLR